MNLSVTISTKKTYLNVVMMFLLKCLCYVRLVKVQAVVELVRIATSKGWMFKYRVGKGKWKKYAFDFDYEIVEGVGQ